MWADPLRNGLPSAIDVERYVLGACLAFTDAFQEIEPLISPEDFTVELYRRLWIEMRTLASTGEAIERGSVTGWLQANGKLQAFGGLTFLLSLDENLPMRFSVAGYVNLLREMTRRRRLIVAAQGLIEQASSGNQSSADVVSWAERTLAELSSADDASESRMEKLEEIILADFEGLCDPSASIKSGVWLPWPSLRRIIPAMLPKQLILIAARPTVGKSASAFQIAYETARRGLPVALFSLEMSKREITARLACSIAKVDSRSWMTGQMGAEISDFRKALTQLAEVPLFVCDRAISTVPSILQKIKRLPVKPRLVVIDYLQLMSGRGENRTQEVSQISRALKIAAQELDTPFLVLSQLSRDSVKSRRAPDLSDLRDSGSLEQDANTVILLHPVDSDFTTNPSPTAEIKFIVAKQRNGRIGAITLDFHKPYTRFEEASA